jgi:N,N-dimethylformamidase
MASIHGYSDRLSAAPGDTIRFMVSCEEAPNFATDIVRLINGDTNPAGPGFKEEVVASTGGDAYPARQQPIHAGSHVVVEDERERLALTDGFSLVALIWPTTPASHTQGVLARWSAERRVGYALAIQDGRLTLWLGDSNGQVSRVSADRPLLGSVWYAVGATYDPERGQASVYQAPLVNFENGLLGPTLAAQETTFVEAAVARGAHSSGDALFLIATLSTAGGPAGGHYNGKIDSPRVYRRAFTRAELESTASAAQPAADGLVADWDFAVGISEHGIPTDLVSDVSGNALHGVCVQMPARAMTGASWTGHEERFVRAPREYGAIHFHDDDLADAGWSPDVTWTVPAALPSGVYAARIRAEDAEEHLPFFVRPGRDAERARILFLVPTASYLAYANARGHVESSAQQPIAGRTPVLDADYLYLAAHPELGNSCYDLHSDGSGVCYSSSRRPIVDLRPRHRNPSTDIWQFPGDLHLVDWLQARGFRYDVVTDEDLDRERLDLVRPYHVVLTGSHPEYYSTRMLDALEGYVQGGGRLMYMGGNGFYWIISYHPEKPYLIEVRRAEAGSRAWQARPGEYFHSTSGERGGLWRNRGRPPQRLVGVGFTAEGVDESSYYRRLPDSFDPRARFIFEGIGDDELIGNFGLVGGGAAGYELDRYSLQLGTPPDALLLATSEGHSDNYPHVVEEILFMFPGQGGTQDPAVRADLVYFSLPNGGAVFSTGSIAWCGSLSHNGYDNNVSRITENVLRRFASN